MRLTLRCFVASVATALAAALSMPPPFTRVLGLTSPPTTGTDVFILQNLLAHAYPSLNATSTFDAATASTLAFFQKSRGLPGSGSMDVRTASAVLADLSDDDYKDDGRPASERGYMYKVVVPVHRNRSVESVATLYAGNGTALYSFTARAHGIDAYPQPAWPYFNSCCDGLNMFSSDGNTPTGLIEFDLNSPEDDPLEFGPYPVNRAVRGIEGNAAFLIPSIRDGILLHTGGWANVSSWTPGKPMPNSLGCVHAYPDSIFTIWQTLVSLGVVVHPNTNGALPYPYKPQGLLSIEQVD